MKTTFILILSAISVIHAQYIEGIFYKKLYECPTVNAVEGIFLTTAGSKFNVVSYVSIENGQNIRIMKGGHEIKYCELDSFDTYGIYKVEDGNFRFPKSSQIDKEELEEAPNFEGIFKSKKASCNNESYNSNGVLVTSDGTEIEMCTDLEAIDGQYLIVNAANWYYFACQGELLKTYFVNDFTIGNKNTNNSVSDSKKNTNNVSEILTTGSNVTLSDAQEALDFHNQARKAVGVPPLTWSAELSAVAQQWADYLANSNNCKMKHRPNEQNPNNYGENIFSGSGKEYTALDASKSWYSEIKDYKNEPINNQNLYIVGHYTQMVWRNTTQIGIGTATCPSGKIMIVANYNPPGNYTDQKAY